ncbi:carbohydrate sulfotransferase 11-like [Saccoglossus kowalevskii]|uniref:Carbohydrate sulfotransferase n=1 Tax=Saccoglossus kowalevskii TaxID=10224 RepID=A0ABM0MCK7_SACKO|nr:PREDICTED: carbohydrate sulfotransferase 11-like [Saccoglossus kowalevskii]
MDRRTYQWAFAILCGFSCVFPILYLSHNSILSQVNVKMKLNRVFNPFQNDAVQTTTTNIDDKFTTTSTPLISRSTVYHREHSEILTTERVPRIMMNHRNHSESSTAERILRNTTPGWTEIQKRRKEHVAMICQQYPELSAERVKYNNLLVDDNYSIFYCPTAKVASTNWRKVLLVLRGTFTNVSEILSNRVVYQSNHPNLGSYTKTEIEIRMRTYTKFMFSRHPIHKLLSAYLDKLGDSPQWVFLKKIRPWMTEVDKISFSDFVNYILKTDSNQLNKHWGLIKNKCNPCNIDFDILGKFETLSEDSKGILNAISASEIVDFPSYATHRTSSASLDVLAKYYSQLSKQQTERLYSKYETDFRLFDYNAVEFF